VFSRVIQFFFRSFSPFAFLVGANKQINWPSSFSHVHNFFLPCSYTRFHTSQGYAVCHFIYACFRYGIGPFSVLFYYIRETCVFSFMFLVFFANCLTFVFFIGWLAGWLGVLVGATWWEFIFYYYLGGLSWFYLYIFGGTCMGGRWGHKREGGLCVGGSFLIFLNYGIKWIDGQAEVIVMVVVVGG